MQTINEASEELEVYHRYVDWANSLDSAGTDSGPAIERATADESILGLIHKNIHDIIEVGQSADQLKKWIFYGKETNRVIPSHFIRTKERDMARINFDDHNTMRLYHALLGLFSEVGELFEMFAAHIFEGHALDWDNFTEEVGDMFWYLALCAKCKDYPTFLPFLISNRAKLMKRYGEGKWTQHGAIDRDITGEMKALKESLGGNEPVVEGCLCYHDVFNTQCPIHGDVKTQFKVASMQGIPAADTGTCPRCPHNWHGERNRCSSVIAEGMVSQHYCECKGALPPRKDPTTEGDIDTQQTRLG